MTLKEAKRIHRSMQLSNLNSGGGSTMNSVVDLDENGIPQDLLHGGHHLQDAPRHQNETAHCPQDDMQRLVCEQNFQRPRPSVN